MRQPNSALLLSLCLTACDGCQREDRPYTPFQIASSVAEASVAADAAEEASASATPTAIHKPAVLVKPPAEQHIVDGRTLRAPKGRRIAQVLVHDFSGNGERDALLWTIPVGEGAPGQVEFAPKQGPARTLYTVPGFMPTGPDCTHQVSFALTGPRTATADAAAICRVGLLPRAPNRVLTVLAPTAERPVRLSLRIIDRPPGESLSFEVDSRDRDGDEHDDVWLRVGESWRKQRAVAAFVWLERAQGASRDTSEPARSLGVLAASALGRSKRESTADRAVDEANAVRLLASSLCAEGGLPRVTLQDGAPLPCSAPLLVDRLALTEIHAALARKDMLAAFGAYERAGWYLGSLSKAQDSAAQKLLRAAVGQVAAKRTTLGVRASRAKARETLGPLAFDDVGDLWVQSDAGLVGVSKDGRPQPADPEAGARSVWSRQVSSATRTLAGVVYACDRPEVLLSWEKPDGRLESEPLALLAPRPGNCAGGSKFSGPALAPLALRDGTVEVLVGATPAGPRTPFAEAALRPHLDGSARSPDGRWLVTITPLGLLLASLNKHELWTHAELEPETLAACTVDLDARRVACVRGSGVELFERP